MPRTLSADEAARALGVKRETLYTYASRGLLRVTKRGRASRYLREDVDALRLRSASAHGHDAAAASALDWGAPILRSDLTTIGPDGPVYRGNVAVDLAERDVPFEAVFDLLVDGTPPRGPFPPIDVPVGSRVASDSAFASLMASLAGWVARDDLRLAVTGPLEDARRRAIVRLLITWSGPTDAAATAPTLGEAAAMALGAPPSLAPAVSRALVVCADHELNASAFAARVAAGTGADTGACVLAALATLSGPRHGGLTAQVEQRLRGVTDDAGVRRQVAEALAAGGPVPGFGHRLYPAGDPRASALIRWATSIDAAAVRPLVAWSDAVADATGEPPSLDVGLVIFARAVGLRDGAAPALFALGRAAGWMAHVREQRASGRMLRPRAA